MPIIKLKKYLSQNAGSVQEFELLVSDKGALKDIPAFCQQQKIQCELKSDPDGESKPLVFFLKL